MTGPHTAPPGASAPATLHAELTVSNRLGLHARAAAKVVSVASRFDASIRVRCGEREVDAKSIMGLLMLAATQGTVLHCSISGEHAQEALDELAALFQRHFDETP